MKKAFFVLLILLFPFFSLSLSNAVGSENEDDVNNNNSPTARAAPKQENSEDFAKIIKAYEERIKKQDERIDSLEKELKSRVGQLSKILEANPPQRRVQRVGVQIWAPIALATLYYLSTRDMSTSLAIASYGISILFVLWSRAFKHEDSFYPMTRTKQPKNHEG